MNTKRALLKAVGGAALLTVTAATHATAPATRPGPRAGYFPNAVFETHEGRKVRFYDDIVRGRVVTFNMMYTACSATCPTVTANLMAVQQALDSRVGRDIHMVSISLLPDFDTPAHLMVYAKQYGVKPGWTFLTGKHAEMDRVRRLLGLYDTDPAEDAKPARHTGMLCVGNEALDRWCMMPALTAPRQIAHAVLNMT
jgi:protein SCO1